jgi:hypothetical protein
MESVLGKGQHKAQLLTQTQATAADLTMKLEGYNDKLYMDNFFSSP